MATQNRYGRFLPREIKKDIEYKELSKKEILHLKKYLDEIYGIEPKILTKYLFLKKGEDVWVTTKKSSTVLRYSDAGVKINSIGFRAIRNSFQTNPKITTNFAQHLGDLITKNIQQIEEMDLEKYIKGYDIQTTQTLIGYCIVKYKNHIIGVGQYKDGNIKNQIPKGRVLKNEVIYRKE